MIKMTNLEMSNAIAALDMASEKGKLGYAVARNSRRLKDAAKEYTDIRNEALKKHAREKAVGDGRVSYTFTTADGKPDLEAQKAFDNEMKQYNDIEHDVDVFQVSEDEFLSGNLTSQQMQYLFWMIKEEPAKDTDSEIQNGE